MESFSFSDWVAQLGVKFFICERGESALDVAVTVYQLFHMAVIITPTPEYYAGIPQEDLIHITQIPLDIEVPIICQIPNGAITSELLTTLLTYDIVLIILSYGFTTAEVQTIFDFITTFQLTPPAVYGVEPRLITFYLSRIGIEMSTYQRDQYLKLTKGISSPVRETSKEPDEISGVANFAYPSFAGGQAHYGTPIDLPESEGGWMTYNKLSHLAEFSEKFTRIIKTFDPEQNTVIFTTHYEQHGLLLLSSLFKMYRGITPFIAHYGQQPKEQEQNVAQFNARGGVLIMNPVQLSSPLRNVRIITVVEGCELKFLQYLLDLIIRNSNYDQEVEVNMILFASVVSSVRNTIDDDFYQEFEDLEQDQKLAFTQLTANADTIQLRNDMLTIVPK